MENGEIITGLFLAASMIAGQHSSSRSQSAHDAVRLDMAKARAASSVSFRARDAATFIFRVTLEPKP